MLESMKWDSRRSQFLISLVAAACGGALAPSSNDAGTGNTTGTSTGTSGVATGSSGATGSTSTIGSTSTSGAGGSAGSGFPGCGGLIGAGGFPAGFAGIPGCYAGSTGTAGADPGYGCLGPTSPGPYAGGTLISSFDMNPGEIIPSASWSATFDGSGSLTMNIEPCGTAGRGLHLTGGGQMVWGAIASAHFISGRQPVDASAYQGITFTIRSPAATTVIVKLQNLDSEPECGRCNDMIMGSECYAGYIKLVPGSRAPTPVALKWTDLQKTPWGYHWPGRTYVDPKQLTTIAFAVDKGLASFDICIDDVALIP